MPQPAVSVSRRSTRRQIAAAHLESLEFRCLLSISHVTGLGDSDITMDPELLARLETPQEHDTGTSISVEAAGVAPDTGSQAPATTASWDAVSFDSNASTAGFYFVPPDPNGAAGPDHVVDVVNTTIQWYTKTGTLQGSMRLGRNSSTAAGSLFAALAPVNALFDPKITYDQYSGRFIVVALEQQDTADGDPVNSSRILVAVSDDSNPNGTWYTQAINSSLTIRGGSYWCDYPGLAVDANALYITGNMFGYGVTGSFGGSRLWILGKTGLYAGGTSTVNLYDPSNLAGVHTEAFTLQPAHMYGTAPGNTGTFLVSSGWNSGSIEQISVIRVSNPLASPTFSNTFVDVGNISSTFTPSGAPQPGTSTTIDAGDGRIFNAVWRDSSLYFANTISPVSGVDSGTATAHWYRFTADSSALSLADQGSIGGEEIATGARTYYPAVTVDASGNMAIGFSASGPSLYAGAYYTVRLATDAPGTVQPASTLAAGQDYYVRTFGTGENRWGDYSGIALDPANGSSFWVFNQYAQTRGTVLSGEDGRWGTRWGTFSFIPATPTAPILYSTYDTGISSSDRLTLYNNASAATRLLFMVANTAAGNTVQVYADGVLIGSATASGSPAAVLTDGSTLLADGPHTITARQSNGSYASPDSPPLSITIDTTAPTVSGFQVNDGAIQRSMVKSLTLSFSEAVASSGAIALLSHAGAAVPNVAVNPAWSPDAMAVTLTFSGSAITGSSLPDGIYDLITTAALLSDLAGNTPAADDVRTFHRLFGDVDGNRVVNALDYAKLKATYGRSSTDPLFNSAFDYEGNGVINALDLAQFRKRYGLLFSY